MMDKVPEALSRVFVAFGSRVSILLMMDKVPKVEEDTPFMEQIT
jgi:hypothetical protein